MVFVTLQGAARRWPPSTWRRASALWTVRGRAAAGRHHLAPRQAAGRRSWAPTISPWWIRETARWSAPSSASAAARIPSSRARRPRALCHQPGGQPDGGARPRHAGGAAASGTSRAGRTASPSTREGKLWMTLRWIGTRRRARPGDRRSGRPIRVGRSPARHLRPAAAGPSRCARASGRRMSAAPAVPRSRRPACQAPAAAAARRPRRARPCGGARLLGVPGLGGAGRAVRSRSAGRAARHRLPHHRHRLEPRGGADRRHPAPPRRARDPVPGG